MAYEQVELASVPFLTFVANKNPKGEAANYSFVLRGYVRHWLGNVWAEYDRVKLLDLVRRIERGCRPARAGRQPRVTGRRSKPRAGLPLPARVHEVSSWRALSFVITYPVNRIGLLAGMPQHTPLYIVASRHPRVGKTLIARLLVEYFRSSGRASGRLRSRPARAGAGGRISPIWSGPLDIAETRGQMALFDRLIADMAHQGDRPRLRPFEQFFAVMAEIGFVQEARRRSIEPIVLYVTDSAPATARAYAELRRRLPQTTSCRCTTNRHRSCSSRRISRRRVPNAA